MPTKNLSLMMYRLFIPTLWKTKFEHLTTELKGKNPPFFNRSTFDHTLVVIYKISSVILSFIKIKDDPRDTGMVQLAINSI